MLKRALVVLEVVVVFFAGTFAARALLNAAGITGSKQAIRAATRTNFDAASVAVPMSIRWAIVIGLAFLVGWFVARHRPRDYGFSLAGKRWTWHLGAGLLVYALGNPPVLILMLLRHYLHLPGGPAVWSEIESATWNMDFWLFMLASSIVLPVLVEETFFRGYAQTRFLTAYRPITAVVVVAVPFILGHTQYVDGTFVGTSMLITGIWWAIVLGVARLRTGSLAAPMLAHALSNTPLRPPLQLAALIVALTVLIATRRRTASLFSPWSRHSPGQS